MRVSEKRELVTRLAIRLLLVLAYLTIAANSRGQSAPALAAAGLAASLAPFTTARNRKATIAVVAADCLVAIVIALYYFRFPEVPALLPFAPATVEIWFSPATDTRFRYLVIAFLSIVGSRFALSVEKGCLLDHVTRAFLAFSLILTMTIWHLLSKPVEIASSTDTGDQPVLSRRELEVLTYLAGNLDYRAIARSLFISPSTVRAHATAIYRKLGVHDRRAAIRRARQFGILPSGDLVETPGSAQQDLPHAPSPVRRDHSRRRRELHLKYTGNTGTGPFPPA
jgi:DNA-binding CsgD family transcriptional regulator